MTRTERQYRSFACWAVRRAWSSERYQPGQAVVAVVERYLAGEADFEEVRKAREAGAGGARGALVCGVSRGLSQAAVQIAAWYTADESAENAARHAIHHCALAAGFRAGGQAGSPSRAGDGECERTALQSASAGDLQALVLANTAAMAIERAFLEGELRRRLNPLPAGAVKRT